MLLGLAKCRLHAGTVRSVCSRDTFFASVSASFIEFDRDWLIGGRLASIGWLVVGWWEMFVCASDL